VVVGKLAGIARTYPAKTEGIFTLSVGDNGLKLRESSWKMTKQPLCDGLIQQQCKVWLDNHPQRQNLPAWAVDENSRWPSYLAWTTWKQGTVSGPCIGPGQISNPLRFESVSTGTTETLDCSGGIDDCTVDSWTMNDETTFEKIRADSNNTDDQRYIPVIFKRVEGFDFEVVKRYTKQAALSNYTTRCGVGTRLAFQYLN